MKNYIGIQDDRHRLIDHDHRLNEKIADLQYIIQPQFIAIDAIIAGEGRMLTPIPFDLNLIIMGNNQVAFDAVCCRIIGVDPRPSITSASPTSAASGRSTLEKIQISGDVTLERSANAGAGLQGRPHPRREVLRGHEHHRLRRPAARSPSTPTTAGAAARARSRRRSRSCGCSTRRCDEKMPRMHVVFGAYRGPIDAKPGEKVVFIGDCANWEGRLGQNAEKEAGHGGLVQIKSVYKDRSQKDPYTAKHEDIFAKMLKVAQKLRDSDGEQVVRFEGCPVSVAEQVLFLVHLGKLKNPYFDTSQIFQFNKAYLQWRSTVALRRAMGKPYQKKGPTDRGDAKPDLP